MVTKRMAVGVRLQRAVKRRQRDIKMKMDGTPYANGSILTEESLTSVNIGIARKAIKSIEWIGAPGCAFESKMLGGSISGGLPCVEGVYAITITVDRDRCPELFREDGFRFDTLLERVKWAMRKTIQKYTNTDGEVVTDSAVTGYFVLDVGPELGAPHLHGSIFIESRRDLDLALEMLDYLHKKIGNLHIKPIVDRDNYRGWATYVTKDREWHSDIPKECNLAPASKHKRMYFTVHKEGREIVKIVLVPKKIGEVWDKYTERTYMTELCLHEAGVTDLHPSDTIMEEAEAATFPAEMSVARITWKFDQTELGEVVDKKNLTSPEFLERMIARGGSLQGLDRDMAIFTAWARTAVNAEKNCAEQQITIDRLFNTRVIGKFIRNACKFGYERACKFLHNCAQTVRKNYMWQDIAALRKVGLDCGLCIITRGGAFLMWDRDFGSIYGINALTPIELYQARIKRETKQK